MSTNLPTDLAAALETFCQQEPTATEAARVGALISGANTQAACAFLLEREARAHLEALGESGGDKTLKKTAKASAYKLKSAGIATTFKPVRQAIDLTPVVDLERVAIVTAPSLGGNLEIVLGTLPGAPGGWLDLMSQDGGAGLDPDMSPGRVRRMATDRTPKRSGHAVAAVHADLAVRAVRTTGSYLDGLKRGRHGAWAGLVAWAARAEALGADPSRADARTAIGAFDPADDIQVLKQLFENQWSGVPGVPDELGSELDVRLAGELHGQEETDEETFCARIESLTGEAIDAWWSKEGVREGTVMMLELGADVIHAAHDRDGAIAFLSAAERLRAHAGPAHASAILSGWIGRLVNPRSAWKHRLAHIHGHAHH